MKQNLQPPATPLEMLSCSFLQACLAIFDLVNMSQETCFIFLRKSLPFLKEHSFTSTFKSFFPE